ncbi:excalibur calcium-binding domain-containing protein [Brachybacterium huguangmaarense]
MVVAAEKDDDAKTKPRGIADTGSGGESKRQKSETTTAPRKADPAPEPAEQEKKKEDKKEDSGGGGSYANCDEVRAAGKAPIRRGDPGFKKKFDRDGDAVGCE